MNARDSAVPSSKERAAAGFRCSRSGEGGRAMWSRHREPAWIRVLGGVEWLFLLAGLLALDVYIWINTSSAVYEAYEDWAFDQDLRGLAPVPLARRQMPPVNWDPASHLRQKICEHHIFLIAPETSAPSGIPLLCA